MSAVNEDWVEEAQPINNLAPLFCRVNGDRSSVWLYLQPTFVLKLQLGETETQLHLHYLADTFVQSDLE